MMILQRTVLVLILVLVATCNSEVRGSTMGLGGGGGTTSTTATATACAAVCTIIITVGATTGVVRTTTSGEASCTKQVRPLAVIRTSRPRGARWQHGKRSTSHVRKNCYGCFGRQCCHLLLSNTHTGWRQLHSKPLPFLFI